MTDKFTQEQQLAIDTTDKSVLVSAAAGSGKTRVLIERIIDIILAGKADVDEMLVVSFTNAAAAEMRLRLSAAISEQMRINPASRTRLREQRDKLYRAYISTFNSFAIRIIREFFYELDMEPGFKVCDEIQAGMLQTEAVDELFEEAFACDNLIEGGSFREFLRLYSSDRSEVAVKRGIIEAYGKLRSMPDYFEWAHERAAMLKTTEKDLRGSELERLLIDDLLRRLEMAGEEMKEVKSLYSEIGLENFYNEKLGIELTQLAHIEEMARNGELSTELIDAMTAFEFPRMPVVKKDYKEAMEEIKPMIKSLRDHYKEIVRDWTLIYIEPSLEQRLAEMNESCRYTEYYLRLLEAFELRYAAAKKELGLMDFSDMEHTAARILENDEIAASLRKRFKFIFVDEYQDTNYIQEHLIGRIAREDNIFKVGDIKQSIYKFRQAEPEIFRDTYRKYSEDGEKAVAIDLSMNFRSNPATINYINTVFEEIMEGYDEHARLYAGLDHVPKEYDFKPELHLLYSEEEDEAAAAEQLTEADEELRAISREEAEAGYVAELAAGLIGQEFYDSKQKTVRRAEARDIVVLLRAVKVRGEIYAAAFRNLEIQSHVADEADYFDTTEIKIALSLLMTIDNMKRDIPLIATLRSEVFGLSTEELATIRAEFRAQKKERSDDLRKDAYSEAVGFYRLKGSDDALRCKLDEAMKQLQAWRELSAMLPLPDFIWQVLTESGYYLYAGAMYDGGRRQANLRALVDRAASFSEERVGGLGEYIRYLESMRTRKLKNSQPSMVSKDDDVVRITTIHKSKGLEYPFVIAAGLGHSFRTAVAGKEFSFDSGTGVGMPYIDPSKRYWRSTIVQRLIGEKADRDSYAEELRILYVAMTRARNKLILVGSERNREKFETDIASRSDFLRVMRKVLNTKDNEYFCRSLKTAASTASGSRISYILNAKSRHADNSELAEEVSRRLGFSYPAEGTKIKAKYSVSELRRLAADAGGGEKPQAEINSKDIDAEDDIENRGGRDRKRDADSAAAVGSAYHRIMQYMDFTRLLDETGRVNKEYIREAAEELRDRGAIAADVYAELKLRRIEVFCDSELGRRAIAAARAGSLRREKAFTMRKPELKVLVQGVIDCCWEENGETVLLDYKSGGIRTGETAETGIERIRQEYAPQIELYCEAIEKAGSERVSQAYLYLFSIGEAVRCR